MNAHSVLVLNLEFVLWLIEAPYRDDRNDPHYTLVNCGRHGPEYLRAWTSNQFE
jgi:hypothetical protein